MGECVLIISWFCNFYFNLLLWFHCLLRLIFNNQSLTSKIFTNKKYFPRLIQFYNYLISSMTISTTNCWSIWPVSVHIFNFVITKVLIADWFLDLSNNKLAWGNIFLSEIFNTKNTTTNQFITLRNPNNDILLNFIC